MVVSLTQRGRKLKGAKNKGSEIERERILMGARNFKVP